MFGPRPFVPYLEVNRWDCRCVNRPASVADLPSERPVVRETSHVA
jgi:hypothetical protein